MTIIKRIILWIINFFKKLFAKKLKKNDEIVNNKNTKELHKNIPNNLVLPSYMMISDEDKLVLINNIQDIKKRFSKDNNSKKEIAKIIALITSLGIDNTDIEDYLNRHDLDKLNDKKIDDLLNNCDIKVKEDIHRIINDYKDNSKTIEKTVYYLDELKEYINNHDISIETSNLINMELSNLNIDKDILDTIKSWDKNIINEVYLEYQKANYVTISTVIIDKIITKYQKIEEDYHHHRFNKLYYEKELGKIKEQIDFLKKIKNSKIVYKEIENLRKELYTKSKDKYDILYNNEVFMNVTKKCDELLDKVNQKVIDIKKNEKNNDEKKEGIKDEYLKRILLRFRDLNLSRDIILLHKEKENEILDYSSISLYLDAIYLEFINGIPDDFNYQRNKAKTELVKLYNDLNNVMSYNKKEKHVSIDHINFRMEDLIDAVTIKKVEVEKEISNSNKLLNSSLVDDKILNIKEKFIENNQTKVLKKNN